METPKTIHQCLSTIMSAVAPVSKDKNNSQQNFKYRGIDDVMNSLHASFAEQGVFIHVAEIKTVERTERQSKSGGLLLYTINDYLFTFSAADGSSVQAWGRGEAMDSADKSSNKAVSIALKYCLLQMFLIPTEEEKDPDAFSPQPAKANFGNRQQPDQKAAKKVTDEAVGIKVLEAALSLDDLKTRWSTLSTELQALENVTTAKEVMKVRLSPRQEPK